MINKIKIKTFFLNSLLFVFLYKASEIYSKGLNNIPSVYMKWEKSIPFIPIFIIPYMTSGILFAISFFIFNDEKKLITYSKKTATLTILSVILFFIFPLQFGFKKPEVNNFFYKILFKSLAMFDSNFNQCPSLHVSYSFMYIYIFFKELKTKIKYFICIWSFLISISVLFVYQHHFIDYIGGLIMFIIVSIIYRK